jgi:hypothetical protein
MKFETFGLNWEFNSDDWINAQVGKEVACFRLKKLMPEFVWDIVHLEDNTYDFVEVQTLLEGITIGGHTLAEQKQVLNQCHSLQQLFDLVKKDKFSFTGEAIKNAHSIIAEEEALEWGCLRKGMVRISGTDHEPPSSTQLESLFVTGIDSLKMITHPVERALAYFCYGSINQFFYDGNKRTSRWTMNGILMSNGYNYLSIPGAKKDEFNQVMIDFYNSKDATNVMRFLKACYQMD